MAYERQDAAYRRAKREGYRSRAAYKLLELDAQFHLLKAGDRVVDLGSWPGAWLQVAAERVGPRGRVVGIDLAAIDAMAPANVRSLVGDVLDPETVARVRAELGAPADVVLVDLAPKLTGVRATDSARQAELVRSAIACARAWLEPSGALLVKLFMDEEYPALMRDLRAGFAEVRLRRPDATRRGSRELYALGRRPRPPSG
ncbi:MAG TPA: RlmE family RNA methyltransferase [Candidatus Bathyarchaeia archaeon]|nr:RlmE family RNA methyltransferase [Candidatus Bathyarchaeia archaeon]